MEMHHPAKIPVGAGFLFLTSPPVKELKVMFNIILIQDSYEICTLATRSNSWMLYFVKLF